MKIRRATQADQATIHELWAEFQLEVPEPEGFLPETWDEEWVDVQKNLATGAVFLAEDEAGPVAVARLDGPQGGSSHIHLVYVRPRARRQGVTKALLRACADVAREQGAQTVSLEVLLANDVARAAWQHLGFKDAWVGMAQPLDTLDARLAEAEDAGDWRATTHVQSDDEVSVERAVGQFLPRLEAPDVRSGESWMRVTDPVLDRDRDAHGRLAKELSERLGAVTVALALEGPVVRFRLYERGLMVDEYLSVPTYYGAIPKGDELALAANPTLVSRLTGADRDDVKRVARNASSPAELPPAPELYEQIAQLMGLEP
ncbi:MAG: Acetyltransferase family [Gaiellaceae bacterium]|nr:Acetyltransferase family [Gaiellaceae bacterium]